MLEILLNKHRDAPYSPLQPAKKTVEWGGGELIRCLRGEVTSPALYFYTPTKMHLMEKSAKIEVR